MEDEDYARELFAILTRPLDPDEPRDAYGTGADGIDRYGGFGTEVVVTSVAAVPGPYGSQLEIGFRIEVPEGRDLPAEGVFHLPLAREWREASGYGAPATYAADVARGTEWAVRRHISSHTRVDPTPVPDRDTQRALLHDALGSFYDVELVAADRIELRHAGQVEWTVLVTPDQWEQVVRRHGPSRDWLQEHFSELLAANMGNDSFLVFWEGDLVKSVRAELPPVSGSTRNLNAALARGPVPGRSGSPTGPAPSCTQETSVAEPTKGDEDYARELFAILTRPPDPDLRPGHLGDDFIDRHDGFGSGLRVTSVDVVPGDHGTQIEVGFVLDLERLGLAHIEQASDRGSLLLPLDAEWRSASGLSEPEDYAPRVASALMRNVSRHVEAQQSVARDLVRLPSRDTQRAWLLQVLGRHGVVEEAEPGRYVVQSGGGHEDLVARITEEEWEQVLARRGAPREGAFDHYEELVASRGPGEDVLVVWEGDLVTSTREELPPVTAPRTPLREIRRRLADARANGTTYGWFAYRPGTEPGPRA